MQCDLRPCALDFFTFTPRNDFEALQQPKAFVQESSDAGPSGRKSLVLNDGESAYLEKPKNSGVVNARSGMEFRQITGTDNRATELRIAL